MVIINLTAIGKLIFSKNILANDFVLKHFLYRLFKSLFLSFKAITSEQNYKQI